MPSVSERFGCDGDGGCDSTFARGSCERSSIDMAGGAGALWERRFGGGETREALEVRKLILELEVAGRGSSCGSGGQARLLQRICRVLKNSRRRGKVSWRRGVHMRFQDADRVRMENWMLTAIAGHTQLEAAKNTMMEGVDSQLCRQDSALSAPNPAPGQPQGTGRCGASSDHAQDGRFPASFVHQCWRHLRDEQTGFLGCEPLLLSYEESTY